MNRLKTIPFVSSLNIVLIPELWSRPFPFSSTHATQNHCIVILINNAMNGFFSCENNFISDDFIFTKITEKFSRHQKKRSLRCEQFQGADVVCFACFHIIPHLRQHTICTYIVSECSATLCVFESLNETYCIWQWTDKHEHTFVDGLYLCLYPFYVVLYPFVHSFRSLMNENHAAHRHNVTGSTFFSYFVSCFCFYFFAFFHHHHLWIRPSQSCCIILMRGNWEHVQDFFLFWVLLIHNFRLFHKDPNLLPFFVPILFFSSRFVHLECNVMYNVGPCTSPFDWSRLMFKVCEMGFNWRR